MTYNEARKALDGIAELPDSFHPCANCPLQPVRPTWKNNKAYCGKCGKRIPLKIKANYCHKCGQEVWWA